jgi:type I restriction enzyme, S subunit
VEVVNTLFKEVDALEELTKERISLKEDFVTSALRRLTETDNTTQEWNYLQQHFSSFFTEKKNIKSLRETILQLAVQGKLTTNWREANFSVEHASELLKRIETEKQQLIAEKKIKKEKLLPPIDDEDKPCELPNSWVWCRFQHIIYSGYTGLERSKNFQSLDYTYGYFKMNNIGDYGQCNWDKFTHVEASDDEVVKYSLKKNDFLFNTRNSYELVGKTCIIDKDYTIPLLFNNNIFKVDFGGKNDPGYINLMFSSPVINKLLDEKKSATTNVAAIYQGKLMELLVVIPPLEEQQAIVEKVNSLMALCDELEQQVDNSQTQIEQLMQSCLKEVFE